MSGAIVVTLAHMRPEVIDFAIRQFYKTMKPGDLLRHFIVDHHYPLRKAETQAMISSLAEEFGMTVLRPDRNYGGHGGYNWVLAQSEVQQLDWDIFVTYDSDSNPLGEGWLNAICEVLRGPDYAYCSLTHQAIIPNHRWRVELYQNQIIQHAERVDMFNVTGWRRDFLTSTGGFLASRKYYGHLEVAMLEAAKKLGRKHCYLQGFQETQCPIAQDPEYIEWKQAHAFLGYAGNFDEFVKERYPDRV